MTDYFFQMGLSNACLSLALGIVAMVVGAKARRPHLAYTLWLLVLVKLVTPPIMTIPIVTIPQQPETTVTINEHSRTELALASSHELDVNAQPDGSLLSRIESVALNHGKKLLSAIWLLGSVIVFTFSMVRVCRFIHLLMAESEVAPQELQTATEKNARRLGLNRIPTICTTSAHLSPMVWWMGGKVRIVIPNALLDQIDTQQSQWILAHELAHVRRRDYLVRWLEWLACVLFWWNPVVWWAQRNLRATEEICCDELVISCLNPKPKFYANSLLSAMEFLARPVFRPPAMVSEINSGGFLERRFKMIVSDKPKRLNSRWLRVCVLLLAAVVLPLSVVYSQDSNDKTEDHLNRAWEKLQAEVDAGNMTAEDAEAKMIEFEEQCAIRAETNAYFEQVWEMLQVQVEAGSLNAEDAEIMMAAVKKKYADQANRAKYEAAAAEIGAAIEAGEITEEQGRARLEGMRRMMAGQSERGQRSITIEEYRRAEAKMWKMVEDGKAKPEDVEHRLIEMRKMIGDRSERGERRISREDYARAEAELDKAIAEGKISPEDARARLNGMRRMMARQSERGQRSITIEEYKRAEAKMRKMIEDGKAKPEDVERRLIEMRKMIGDRSELGERGISREDYRRIEAELKKTVAEGRISEEDAKARLSAMRREMAEQSERSSQRSER